MKIFISYRRIDSADVAGRIADRLAARFGVASVFKDVDSICRNASSWTDFLQAMLLEIQQCDVFLAIIGPQWLTATDGAGRVRMADPEDHLRLEVETALRCGVPVVPILVSGASLPRSEELPESLQALVYRHAIEMRPDPNFHSDADRLVQALEQLVSQLPKRRSDQSKPVPNVDMSAFAAVRVFISHSSLDREWIEAEVVATLERRKIQTWYSKVAIKTAAQWEREIVRGLESCDWFLLVASPNSAKSEWVRDEVYWAIFHRADKIITVIKEECNLWDFHMRIPRLQHIDFRGDSAEAHNELLGLF